MPLSAHDREELVRIAREAIEASAADRSSPPEGPAKCSADLEADSGAFVSIYRRGRLRGCVGLFTSADPLWKTVSGMAAASASQDPRFDPVGPEELAELDIEISVLSPLREVKDISEIEVGRHGIYILKGRSRGCLLPQVAVEHGFDRETFLSETCLKAGLAPDAWKEGATVLVFEAEIFGAKAGNSKASQRG